MNILFVVPADYRDKFKAAAEAEGVSLSEWIRLACIERLPKKNRKGLSEPRRRGRPKKQEHK